MRGKDEEEVVKGVEEEEEEEIAGIRFLDGYHFQCFENLQRKIILIISESIDVNHVYT